MNVAWDHSHQEDGAPHAAGIPQSRWCLTPSAAAARLAPLLAPGSDRDWRVIGIRLRPGTALEVTYGIPAPSGERVVTCRFARDGRLPRVADEARAGAADPSRVWVLEGLDAVATVFPDDARLPSLSRVMAAAACPGLNGPPASRRVLGYEPGRRCAVAVRGEGGEAVVAKVGPGAAAAHTRLTGLWDRAGADVPTPPPIDCDPAGETRWEGFVDGDGFSSRAAAVGPQVAAAEAMAALVALHAVPLEGLPRQDSGTVLARTAGTALRRIEKAGLAAAEDCRRVCATLGTDPPPLDARDAVTLHGDFHTGNTIHGEGRATLIDMDDLASGDAAFDVAMFASRILLVQMVAGDDGSAAAAAAAGIGRSYEAAGGAPIDPARLAWFVAALLIGRQVKTCVTHAAPDLDALARRLAGLAAAVARARRLDAETLEPWLDGR